MTSYLLLKIKFPQRAGERHTKRKIHLTLVHASLVYYNLLWLQFFHLGSSSLFSFKVHPHDPWLMKPLEISVQLPVFSLISLRALLPLSPCISVFWVYLYIDYGLLKNRVLLQIPLQYWTLISKRKKEKEIQGRCQDTNILLGHWTPVYSTFYLSKSLDHVL